MSQDKARLEAVIRGLQDKCRFCGCNGESCKTEDGDLCCWIDALRTACSGVACKVAYYRGKRVRKVRRGGRAA